MSQGGIDPGEDYIAAAKRELVEETGMTSVKVLAEVQRPANIGALLLVFWVVKLQ